MSYNCGAMDERELIKSKIDIVEFISSYIPLKKTGRNWRATCPFHSERTPSFTVSPERQIFKCFGCGKAGDIFGFLMEYEKMGFGEAIRTLADRVGVKLEYRGGGNKRERDEKEILFEINHLTSEFYCYVLTNTKFGERAFAYLSGRGITKESIKLFKIGYAPNSFQSLTKFLLKKGYKVEDLVKSGVVLGGRGGVGSVGLKDRFYGRLMFSLFDHRGNCVGFAGRVLPSAEQNTSDSSQTLKIGKYINTSETPVYHKSEVLYGFNITKDYARKEDFALIVEGEIDLIKAYQAGTKNVVAIKGSALTEQQISLLKRYTQNLKICLDSDIAGQMAAIRGIAIAERADLNVKVIELVSGKDPDECISNSIKDWKKSLQAARDIWQFYIDMATRQFDLKDTYGAKRFTEFVLPKINGISNLVVRDHYVKKLARVLGVSEEVVEREMEAMGKKQSVNRYIGKSVNQYVGKTVEKDRREKLEENLLALILQSDDAKKYVAASDKVAASNAVMEPNKIETSDVSTNFNIKTPIIKKIYDRLVDFVAKDVFTIQNFVNNLPEELKDKTDELYLKDLGFENLLDVIEKQIQETSQEIQKLDLKEKIGEILEKMNRTDEESEEFAAINRELQGLSAELKKLE